jgi:hypothetical protein
MKSLSALPVLDWVKRVNRTWLVRGRINEHADAWLEYLASLADGRLLRSCGNARAMCDARERLDDPKPWFYAGLFSLATADEARRFLATHRITSAAIPSMWDDPDVSLWLDRAGPETRVLIDRLRANISRLR